VTDEAERPVWKTGWLWGVLALLLLVGTVGAATFVYGLTGLAAGDVASVVALGLGGFVAFVAFLLIAGVLYRVDRYRGTPQRRVELFE
jgi:membrane protein implicated in regulation of membrane protease activity